MKPSFLMMLTRVSVAGIAITIGVPAWAAIVPCPIAPTALATIPVTPTNGCNAGSIQFSNFVAGVVSAPTTILGTTVVANAWGAPPTTSTIDLNGLGNGIQLRTPGTCDSNTATAGTYCVQGANQSMSATLTYSMHATAAAISTMSLSGTVVSHSSGGGGATAAVFREMCLGTSTFSCVAGDANYVAISIGAVQGQFQTLSQSASTTFQTAVTDIAVRDTVFLQTQNGNGSFAEVTIFDVGSVPEPATLSMVGIALAVLGALRFRKRK